MQPQKLLIVFNPISGDNIDKDEIELLIKVFCDEERIDFSIYKTTADQKNDQKVILKYIEDEHPDAVVAVGGDGTVSLVANLLIGKPIPMGILPLGSGNGLSKDLKIPQETTEALHIIQNFQIQTIDTLTINGLPCVHIGDIGFNAVIVDRFTKDEGRGLTTYAWNTVKEFTDYQPKQYKVVTDNGEFEGTAFMIAFTNANAFGSNATINPTGIINDGLFEICIIKEFPKLEGVGILYRLLVGDIDQSMHYEIIQCTKASISNPDLELIQIDGEPIDATEIVDISINPSSLHIIVP
ncbi:diacylglycerol kinase family protein [Cytophagaceae bacterium YF14B1]|uniref:Diacylglycerol kinase family protein n=1 Tax=Xanthocytophaga flava TaxID=3048013 RepID=A0AAE3QUV0_9BACT|nr:diacylglycerol kinase family protein [Xanthocytophaga flavus]MDJ1483685.1 diacylglycerol kinase family protein [Xanthocytophaga flavus]